MNVLEYKGYKARVELDPDDECFVGRLAGINDVVGFHGSSIEEIKAAFHEAVEDYLETCRKVGKTPERPYSGKVMFRIDPEIHARAARAAELSGVSLNQWAEKVLAEAVMRNAGGGLGHGVAPAPSVKSQRGLTGTRKIDV
jgi:predicted HicB family RNase H-like nuclease